MKLLKINVTDNKVFINEPVEINTGEYRVTTVQFTFPTEWNGLIKKAKFGKYTETLVNDSCYFPIILRAGVVPIKVFGYSETEQNGETVMELVYSPQPTNIRINQGSYDYEHGDAPIVPEPDEEYLDKATLWDGYSAYFERLIDPPELAVLEFESVDIAPMTLEEVVTEIEVINKKILDAQSDDVSDVCVNGHSVVTNHIANISIPNTVEDVKVNGSSVVDNNNVANISVPTNYVTTDTDQAITARKDFYWHSESDGVNRSQTFEVSSAELYYHGERIDGVNDTNDSVIVSFPMEQDDGFIIIGKNDEECTYAPPKFTDGETYQLAVTDDIPTNYLTTNTNQWDLTGSKTWTDGRNSFIGIYPTATPDLRIRDPIGGTTNYHAGKIHQGAYDLVFPTTKGGTFALTSDIPDVSNFITSSVNNLVNYYKKSETYTQAEVNALINALTTIDIQVVQTLPTQDVSTTTIYLVPRSTAETSNVYDEYIYVSNSWEKIGSTDIDLSNYYTKIESDGKFQLIIDDYHKLSSDLIDDTNQDNKFVTSSEKTTWNGKADIADIPTKTSELTNDSDFVSDSNYVHTDNNFTLSEKTKLSGIESGAEANVQSNWSETDSSSDSYIQNKPTIPTNNNQLTNGAGYQTASNVSTAIANNQFIATYSKNSNNLWVCDKTFAEIEAAIAAKKEVSAVTNDDFVGLPLKTYYTLEFYVPNAGVGFTNVGSLTGTSGSYTVRLLSHLSIPGTGESININDVDVNLNLKENVANKVTTIDTSSPSTTEYPSESAVVSYVSGIVGGINTVLDSINGEVI